MAGQKGRSGGHNRKSVEELELSGTARNDRHGNMQLDEAEAIPQIIWDTRDKIYQDVRDYLEATRTGRAQDHIYISQLADAQMLYILASQRIEEDGPDAKFGGNRLAISVMNDQAKEVRILMAELRLSPATREKVFTAPKVVDELDDILKGVG